MKGQSTVELALLLPVLAGLIALTLQGGLVLSDQIALQHYANEAGLWAQRNQGTAGAAAIQSHTYQQMCGGASGPPSSSGSKYCQGSGLTVSVTELSTPTTMASPVRTSEVLGSTTNCKGWSLSVSPTSTTAAQGASVTYTVTLTNVNGNGNSPQVTLSLSGYPNATSPGTPLFNPPTLTTGSPTATTTFSTTGATTPQTWTMQFGGRDQCGVGPASGLVSATLTVTGTASPSPCSPGVTVMQPSPSTVPPGSVSTVTIAGTGFQSGATVTFGATSATSVTVNSTTQLTAVVPSTMTVGTYNVSVHNTSGCTGTVFNALTVQVGASPSPSAAPSPSPSPGASPSAGAAGYNACAGGAGSFETQIVITWNEDLVIPWLAPSMQLRATQFTFCQ